MRSATRFGAALIGALMFTSPPAGAAQPSGDVGQWALSDAIVAVAFRGAGTLADRIEAVEGRFGDAPRLATALATLRGFEIEGIKPGRGQWMPGLRPELGVGLSVSARERVRLVVGASDVDQAVASLRVIAEWIELDVRINDDRDEPGPRLTCAMRAALLVCDSEQVPDTAPGALEGMDPSSWFSLRATDQALMGLPQPFALVAQALHVDVKATDAAVEARAHLALRKDAMMALGPLGPVIHPKGADNLTRAVHPRTPYLLKLSLDGAALMQLLTIQAPLEMHPKLKAIADRWSGELGLSFVGGLADPVLSLGLTDGSTASDLVAALAALLHVDELSAADEDGALTLRITPADSETTTARLPYRAIGRTVALGLDSVDLERLAKEHSQPPELPAGLASRGAHGVFLAHVPTSGGGKVPDFIEWGEPYAAQATAAMVWLQLEAALIDSMSMVVRTADDGLHLEMGWSRL